MTSDDFKALVAAQRSGSREQYHRFVFEALMSGKWLARAPQFGPDESAEVIRLLQLWVAQAPTGDQLSELRLVAARRALRTLIAGLHCSAAQFMAGALQISEPAPFAAPASLPFWKQRKLALLADATLIAPAALPGWQRADAVTAALFGIIALDDEPLEAVRAGALDALAEWVSTVPPVDFFPGLLTQLQMSAFTVSYLGTAAKHLAKRAIVAQAAHMLRDVPRQLAAPVPPGAGARPRLTVVAELFFPQHAMFRCYAEAVAQLQQHFHVTLVADTPTRCPEHGEIANEVKYFAPHERDVRVLAQLVASTRPDVIVYPSVGMSLWTFALSLLRLAPLQLASVGHPAPVCSDQIDGTLVFDKLVPASSEGYASLVSYGSQPLPAPPPGSRAPVRHADGAAPVVGINAAFMKLNANFLDIVGQIMAGAPDGTALRFFPNLRGAEYAAFTWRLQQQFPAAQVFEATGYADYMSDLGACDLVLQSFPFGGTNTTMDALSLGVPILCYKGSDLSALVDPLLLENAGLDALCADSHAAYRDTALRLLNDPAALAQVSALARQACGRLGVAARTAASTMADAVFAAWSA